MHAEGTEQKVENMQIREPDLLGRLQVFKSAVRPGFSSWHDFGSVALEKLLHTVPPRFTALLFRKQNSCYFSAALHYGNKINSNCRVSRNSSDKIRQVIFRYFSFHIQVFITSQLLNRHRKAIYPTPFKTWNYKITIKSIQTYKHTSNPQARIA